MPRMNSATPATARRVSAPQARSTNLLVARWEDLPDEVQLMLSSQALLRAADIIARQAEALAGEIENGGLADLGGSEALRLLAAVIRRSGEHPLVPAGEA
jgi:hypothetical protein